jgi:hypothetical protein
MQPSGLRQLMATGFRRLRHLGALEGLAVASSCECSRLVVLEHRWVSAQADSLVVAVVVALRLPLYAVPALTVAMTTADVVTEDFVQLRQLGLWMRMRMLCNWGISYLFRMPRFHLQRFPASLRWRGVKVSFPRQVARAVTEDVVAGMSVRAVVLAVCMDLKEHLMLQCIHESVCVGSRPRVVVVGKRPGPARCRVPYWQDASPWRRKKSRVTAEAA